MNQQKQAGLFEYILTNYRGVFATIFLLPISVAYNVYLSLRNKISFAFHSAPAKHDERVEGIQKQIEQWIQEGAKQQLCTSRSPWQVMSELVPAYKLSRKKIYINSLPIPSLKAIRIILFKFLTTGN